MIDEEKSFVIREGIRGVFTEERGRQGGCEIVS